MQRPLAVLRTVQLMSTGSAAPSPPEEIHFQGGAGATAAQAGQGRAQAVVAVGIGQQPVQRAAEQGLLRRARPICAGRGWTPRWRH